MNTKEKILFISHPDFVTKLHESHLDFENHNRLLWCHLAAISFLSSGIAEFHLDLTYSYLLLSTDKDTKELGLQLDTNSLSFITTSNALIQFNNRCTRNSLRINNPVLGYMDCFDFKNSFEKYINTHIKLKDMTEQQYKTYPFNNLFLKFKIRNRKSDITQNNFVALLNEQCPEINYFINYLKTKDKLVAKENSQQIKKLKI